MYSEYSSALVESLVLSVLQEPSSEQLSSEELSLDESVLGLLYEKILPSSESAESKLVGRSAGIQ